MQRLENLREKVRSLYEAKNPNADKWIDWGYKNYVLVVAGKAERLAKEHGANVEFAVAGALLHDVADAVMERKNPEHEQESLKLAAGILQETGYDEQEVAEIVDDIITPHSCNALMPQTLEAKILATADGAAHFTTDFYLYFCWQNYGPGGYETFKKFALQKINKDYTRKIFFEDVKTEITPMYEALKLLLS